MAGPESIIPNIVEKIGDIDWAEFWKRLVGGVNPDEGLPAADEVAAGEMQRNAPKNPDGTEVVEVAELTMAEKWTSLDRRMIELMEIISPNSTVPIEIGHVSYEEWAKVSLQASRTLEDEVVAMINDPVVNVKEQYPEVYNELKDLQEALDGYQTTLENQSGKTAWFGGARKTLAQAVFKASDSLSRNGIIFMSDLVFLA